jgi:hypothetical protein
MVRKQANWMLHSVAIALVVLLVGLFGPSLIAVQGQASATLALEPATMPQNSSVTITMDGFRPLEKVNVWEVFEDGTLVELGDVEVNRAGQAEMSLFIGSNVAPGMISFRVKGHESLRKAEAMLTLTPGQGEAPSDNVAILVQADQQGWADKFTFTGSGFQPQEKVSLWFNKPDGTVEGMDEVFANAQGVFQTGLRLSGEYVGGEYILTARGQRSGFVGITPFYKIRHEPGSVTPKLYVTPTQVSMPALLTVEGHDFGSSEKVMLWYNFADGSTRNIGQAKTFDDGFFAIEMSETDLPVGAHSITAQGMESGHVMVTYFEVHP